MCPQKCLSHATEINSFLIRRKKSISRPNWVLFAYCQHQFCQFYLSLSLSHWTRVCLAAVTSHNLLLSARQQLMPSNPSSVPCPIRRLFVFAVGKCKFKWTQPALHPTTAIPLLAVPSLPALHPSSKASLSGFGLINQREQLVLSDSPPAAMLTVFSLPTSTTPWPGRRHQ